MLWRVLICEDNKKVNIMLKEFIDQQSAFKVIGSTENGLDAIEYVKKLKPHLLVADISLPDILGTKLAANVREINPDLRIIFTTGYTDYYQEAFEVYADDYIMKPISSKRLHNTLLRIDRSLNQGNPHQRLILKQQKSQQVIPINEILFLEKKGRHTHLTTARDCFESRVTLVNLLGQLPSFFLQINRQQALNILGVEQVDVCLKEKYYLIKMRGLKQYFEVTPAYSQRFLQALKSL